MHFYQHEIGVKLLELLACELQIESTLPNLHESSAIVFASCAGTHSSLEQISFHLLNHLQKLLEFLQEVGVVEAISNKLVLP